MCYHEFNLSAATTIANMTADWIGAIAGIAGVFVAIIVAYLQPKGLTRSGRVTSRASSTEVDQEGPYEAYSRGVTLAC